MAEATLCKKLLHGAMIARNAQRKGDESDCPADGEIVFIHTEKLFRPETARKDAPIGAEQKEVTVIFSDSSIRSRKQRVRGSYTSKSNACLFLASLCQPWCLKSRTLTSADTTWVTSLPQFRLFRLKTCGT